MLVDPPHDEMNNQICSSWNYYCEEQGKVNRPSSSSRFHFGGKRNETQFHPPSGINPKVNLKPYMDGLPHQINQHEAWSAKVRRIHMGEILKANSWGKFPDDFLIGYELSWGF